MVQTVVDGCFDPLHAGHLRYLAEAYRLFGPLTALIASDADIRAKGREPLMPAEARCAVVGALRWVESAQVKDRPLRAMVEALGGIERVRLVKGSDWRGQLPAEWAGLHVKYLDTPRESSTRILSDWVTRQSEADLDTLERLIVTQQPTPVDAFGAAYFGAEWRGSAPYTLDVRREIEGRHPDIIAEIWRGCTVLDVGCGPGYLVHLLRERGMDAGGIEPSAAAVAMAPETTRPWVMGGDASALPAAVADVVICREVLEHLTFAAAAEMVSHLFRLARKAVYLTTRFHPSPLSVYRVTDEPEVDPTHITLMTRPMLRSLCVLAGGRRMPEWESALDWQGKGRVLAYAV